MLLRSIWLTLIGFCLIFQIFLIHHLGIFSFLSTNNDEWSNFKKTNYLLENFTTVQGIPDTCSLANYSSWDPRIMNYTDVYWERKEMLCEKPEEWSYLEEQVLKSRHGYRCRGRCVSYHGYFLYGKWQAQETKFDCDYVQTECWRTKGMLYDNIPLDTRGSIHFQLVEKPTPVPPPSPKKYNIFVLLIDSAAFHQSRRNLPKTLYFMDRELEAVEFGYLNKLGMNSYPNAIPLWYGKAVDDIEKQMLNGQNFTPADWEQVCNDTKNRRHITTIAKNAGYQTMHSEYWMFTTLKDGNFPCANYTMYFRADHDVVPLYNKKLFEEIRPATRCQRLRKGLLEELDYYGQFINSYKDKPKFGFMWLVTGSHENEKESMLEDTEIYDFLIKNKEELSNSFVFIMGDHGLRFGRKMDIDLGEYDNRNPLLSISIPKELRGGRLMANLRKNSKQLQTHYDTRATWLDIIKHQPTVKFQAWKMDNFGEEKGNSYLREQPKPRTCHTLPIPFQYCLCEYKMETVDSNSTLGKTLGNYVLDQINEKIVKANHASKCGMWQLKEAEIEGYYPIRESGTFKILINVRQDGMEKGKIRATVQIDNRGHLKMIHDARVDRITSASCADKKIREYCYCSIMALLRDELSDFISSIMFWKKK